MMAYSVKFSDGADADLDGILHFIAQDSPLRAISFVDNLRQKTIDALEIFPNAGRQFGATRMLSFGNYVVIYRVDDSAKTVSVILVTEGHRDWQEHLEDRL
jgi:toxin ParE1/3/4